MSDTTAKPLVIAAHGATRLPSVTVDSYNIESKDEDGFVGDRASKRAFHEIVEHLRKLLREDGDDPLGDEHSEDFGKKELDAILIEGDPKAAGVLLGAIEEFAQDLASVIRRFLKLKGWQNTERIVIGGGFRGRRIGEMVIGRTQVILKESDTEIELQGIRHDPDEAGILGVMHLAPSWMFKGYDAILGVDIGGSNIRAGVIETNQKKASDLSKAKIWKAELWRYADEANISRSDAIDRLVAMLRKLISRAEKEKFVIAPFIGIGCPGLIDEDGSIERGAQNLPGNWSGKNFNLPATLQKAIPRIDDHETAVVMHNDAVTQGLSEVPFMQDVKRWGVLTIGTGLGNARFTNRHSEKE
jgi:predicted NBD/HSP70 family sugar kinase